MAGSPLKRQRKLGVRDEDGNLVRFPYLHPVSGRNGPRDWRAWSPAQKLEYLLGMTLDDMHDILAWSPNELDPYRLGVLAQVAFTVLKIGVKAGLHKKAHRERQRKEVLERIEAALHARTRGDWTTPEPAADPGLRVRRRLVRVSPPPGAGVPELNALDRYRNIRSR
jgi:hypothetical protein